MPPFHLYDNRSSHVLELHCPVSLESTVLHPIRIDGRCRAAGELSMPRSVSSVEVHVFDIEGVDVAGEITQERETDVDEEIKSAAGD